MVDLIEEFKPNGNKKYYLFVDSYFQKLDFSAKAGKILSIKIIGVIVASLAVAFLGKAAEDNPTDMLNIGIGSGAVVAGLVVFVTLTSGKNKSGMVGMKQDSKE